MKTLLSLTAVILSLTIYGQAPQAIKYQATARDSSGNLLMNQTIGLRITIIDSASGGLIAYQETHTTLTNQYGLLNVDIGRGIQLSGTALSSVNWSTFNKWLQIEIDPQGGSNYSLMGLSEMLSVPYAIYATGGQTLRAFTFNPILDELTITDDGTSLSVNLHDLADDSDSDPTNECNFQLSFDTMLYVLDITDACGTHSVDLSALLSQDNDNDSTNELQSLSSVKVGNSITINISNGIGTTFSVADGGGPWLPNGSDVSINGSVAIGTTNTPTTKLQVSNGDVYIDNIGSGVIMKSPNGNCWRVTVDNTGGFVSNAIACP